ncbi:hypothetical protein T484DRAFT_1968139 [Baffinella frigidus]|nr:hypothetical protein T484DRAFT_1968139 [Cryptophyta sp. CCMP2293]
MMSSSREDIAARVWRCTCLCCGEHEQALWYWGKWEFCCGVGRTRPTLRMARKSH